MKKATTSPPVMATNRPSVAAVLYANRKSLDLGAGSGLVDTARDACELCFGHRHACSAVAAAG